MLLVIALGIGELHIYATPGQLSQLSVDSNTAKKLKTTIVTKHSPNPPKKAASSAPAYVDALMRKINEAWARFDFQKAIDMMEQACRSYPAQAGLYLNLGHMYGTIHNYASAERSYDQAIKLAANKTVALAAVGQKCIDFENYALAERYLKTALEQKDVTPAIILKLAEVCERRRQLENAATLVDRTLKSDPNCAPALLLRARLEHQAGKFEMAETSLRAFPEGVDPNLRANAAYELGAVLDRQGRYDEAMTAILDAKALLLPSASSRIADLKSIRQRIQTMQANLTSETLQRWFGSGHNWQPPRRLTLLGGHPRSGTTLLEQIVDTHPDVVSAEETDIFHNQTYMPLTLGHPSSDPVLSILEATSDELLQQARKSYFRSIELFLGQDIGRRLLIDKNPALTFMIPPLIRIFPEIKLLIALRDPRDVVLSCFMQPFKPGIFSSPFLTLEGTV